MGEEKVKQLIESFYENFLARDLTYVAAGAIVVWSFLYAFNYDVKKYAEFATFNVYRFSVFLAASFFVGIVIKEGICYLFNFQHVRDRISRKNYIDSCTNMPKEGKSISVREVHRTIFLEHVGVSFYIGSLISMILLIAKPVLHWRRGDPIDWVEYASLICVLVVFCICGFKEYHVKHEQTKELWTALSANKKHE